jgi:hypothetical protein
MLTCCVCMVAGVECAVDQGCLQVRTLRMHQHRWQLQVSAGLVLCCCALPPAPTGAWALSHVRPWMKCGGASGLTAANPLWFKTYDFGNCTCIPVPAVYYYLLTLLRAPAFHLPVAPMCSCTGPLPNMCTAEHNYGNCWKETIGGKLYTACKDNIRLYKWQSQYGALNATTPTFECSCPACFRELPGGGCEPACDLSHCDRELGCYGPVPGPAAGGSTGSRKGEHSVTLQLPIVISVVEGFVEQVQAAAGNLLLAAAQRQLAGITCCNTCHCVVAALAVLLVALPDTPHFIRICLLTLC